MRNQKVTALNHLLGFHMHQPPGNLELLINNYEWEARQIMLCYERRQTADPRLARALESILRAETSCYLFWGDAWIPKLYEETRVAHQMIDEITQASQQRAPAAGR
ncbi:MAG: hypothetical protein DMG24_13405 [Acidobacteria bacterium]|nr:MAG: hypothetical protein DMG24_13405 [Acidobacteriota bacterium]